MATGSNVTVNVMLAPPAITAPGAGAPDTPKEPSGGTTRFTVSEAPLVLVNVTLVAACAPTVTPPKLT